MNADVGVRYETMTDQDVSYLRPLWHREYAADIGLAIVGSRYEITSEIVLPHLMRRLGWNTLHRDASTMLIIITPDRYAR